MHLFSGDLEQAHKAVEAHARDAATGRVMSHATDSLLVLAAIARTEGDTATAIELLMNLGVVQAGALLHYSRHLAAELGVGPEFRARESAMRRDLNGDTLRRRAAEDLDTLRREIRRRGWGV